MQGGAYSTENVQTYSASIGAIDAHMRATKDNETAGLQSLRSQLTQEVCSFVFFCIRFALFIRC